VPLPSSGNRGRVKPVALEFSADLFRGNPREKDLESISLNVIDQAHATRKLLFSGFVVLGVLDYGQALLKSADVGRIVRESVIGKASSVDEVLHEKFGDCFLREAKVGEASRSALRISWFARFITP
jgi:hypothetical protein